MATKESILEATIDVFNDKGIKFTMDELAHSLSISKKTIYTFFPDKKTLFIEMTNYIFDQIKETERVIYEDENYTTMEKFEKILIALPERFWDIDFTKLTALREDYPEIYGQIAHRLDSGWEMTLELFDRAQKEGLVRKIDTRILKAMLEGTINQLLAGGAMTNREYREALNETLDVLMNGMLVRE